MVEEMRQMNAGIGMNQPVEQLLYQFAVRSECEDIMEFAEVFRFAKCEVKFVNTNLVIKKMTLRSFF